MTRASFHMLRGAFSSVSATRSPKAMFLVGFDHFERRFSEETYSWRQRVQTGLLDIELDASA